MLFITFFSLFIVFNTLDKDYDAALMSASVCGFGLGATPNAIANMITITKEKGILVPFLLIPVIGGIISDFINIVVITSFIEFLTK